METLEALMVHQYKAITLSYFESAPIRLDVEIGVDRPVGQLWPIFADNRSWEAFTSAIKKAAWITPPPVRAGSERRVQLQGIAGNGVVNEVFFDWRPDQQFAFYFKDGTSGMLGAYGEWWSMEELGGGKTRLRLRTAFELNNRILQRLAWVARPLLNWGYYKHLQSVRKYILDRSDNSGRSQT